MLEQDLKYIKQLDINHVATYSLILEEKEKLPLETTTTPEIKKFFVDIKGAVKKPGVYEVEESKSN